jgi:thioredoxin-like negative regulator of GroEL
VTDEGQSITDKWIDSKGAEYAYAFDKSREVHEFFGVRGIPTAVLIDASGTVVWKGHPSSLSGGEVEKHLDGALKTPVWDWPKSAKSARSALLKGDLGKALMAIEKVSEADVREALAADIRGLIKMRVDGMTRALEAGNYLGAQTLAKELKKTLAGLEEEAVAVKVLADVEAAPDAEAVLKHQHAVAKIRKKDPTKKADIEKAIEKLKDIKADAQGTYAYEEAEALIKTLQRRRRS